MTLRKLSPAPARVQRRPAMQFDPARRPERLVGIGFRCWLAGYENCDIDCWETGWNTYAGALGTDRAKAAVSELSCWVRTVHRKACRKISVYPFGCTTFCRDECMAISMVAASQHSACPAMRACAFALLDSSDIDGVVDSATSFADVLRDSGHVLSARSICNDTLMSALAAQPAHQGRH